MKFPLLVILLLPLSAFAAPADAWDPKSTWVFAVGVIQFDDPHLATYPEKGRVDAEMIQAYQRRGVPADQIVFLKDRDATKANIAKNLAALLAKTHAGDTFVFYYAGHGSRDYHDPARPVAFVTYDTKSKWTIKELLSQVNGNFKGDRVILTADCCYSGGLAEESKRHAGTIAFAALTSAQPTSTSTGHWTFTQGLTDLLNGSPLLDLDHDGSISFREAAEYLNVEMAFGEGQLASFVTGNGFSPELLMAQAAHESPGARAGTRCEAKYENKWYKAKILKEKDRQVYVSWIGWNDSYNSWVDVQDLRPIAAPAIAAGTRVSIEWDHQWYPGKVLQSELGLQLVHYDGYDDIDDEWVSVERLKRL